MKLYTCTGCGQPVERRNMRERRCPACRPAGRDDRSPTTRAQNAEYQRERQRILASSPPCALRILCDGAPATTVDHLRPVARGGQHRDNLIPACGPCNASKGAREAPARSTQALGRGRDAEPIARQPEPPRTPLPRLT